MLRLLASAKNGLNDVPNKLIKFFGGSEGNDFTCAILTIQVRVTLESIREMTNQKIIISLKAYRTYIQEIEKVCRDWLDKRISDDEFLNLCKTKFTKSYSIHEAMEAGEKNSDLAVACDEAFDDYGNIAILMESIRLVIQAMRLSPKVQDDPILKLSLLANEIMVDGFNPKRVARQYDASDDFKWLPSLEQ